MKEEKRIRRLRKRVLELIPDEFVELRKMIEKRTLGEIELRILKDVSIKMRARNLDKEGRKNYMKRIFFGIFPTQP